MRFQLASIQHLRFLAAACVLFGHTLHEANEWFNVPFDTPPILEWGIGVEIFFVISGFVMFLTSGARFGERGFAGEFFRRRIERVVPMYWFFTTLMLAAILILPHAIDQPIGDPAYVASSYFFVPWPRGEAELRPLLALGWTLNYEMFFYALFAICLLLPRRIGPMVLTAVLVGGVAMHSRIPERWWILHFWTQPVVLEFLVGVGLARLHQMGFQLSRSVAGIGVAVAVVMAVVFRQLEFADGWLRTGVPAAVLTTVWLLGPGLVPQGRLSRVLSFGGDASYALYLSHPFALNLLAMGWERLGFREPWLFVAVSCVFALGVAAVVHAALERPLMAWIRDRTPPKVWSPRWLGSWLRGKARA